MSWQNTVLIKPLARLFGYQMKRAIRRGVPFPVALRRAMLSGSKFSPVHKNYRERSDILDNVPVLWLEPNNKQSDLLLFYIHGGAFIGGCPDVFKGMVSNLASRLNCDACLIDYRLAPEHPFPSALEDCMTVYRNLLNKSYAPKNIIIAGDSAGGNLVMASLLTMKDEQIPLPLAAIDISGVHNIQIDKQAIESKEKTDLIVNRTMIEHMDSMYVKESDKSNPYLSPVHGNLSNLPPIYQLVSNSEILYGDGIEFNKALKKFGVEVTLEVGEEMLHDWPMFYTMLPEATKSLDNMANFIKKQQALSDQDGLKKVA